MAMVEMVFVLPLLLMLVFAIAELGLMFNRWLTLSNAVREGARVAVVFRNPCNDATVVNEAKDAVVNYANSAGLVIPRADINVQGTCEDETGPNGGQLTVDASHAFQFDIPFASLGNIDLVYSSTMRNEQ
jgi:Flp pilus assembly protein TadG